MNSNQAYLPGLHGIRAIASVLVLIAHSNKALNDILGLDDLPLSGNGLVGVTMFFVLSGFLITYRLFLEAPKGLINIKHFYLRRVFRIFPLYYSYLAICILITYFIRPDLMNLPVLPFYLFLFPNLPWIFSVGLPNLHHYWSLGVEEQFYLFWPLIFKFGFKKILNLSILTFFVFFLTKLYLSTLEQSPIVSSLIYSMGFHNILLGCLGAILFVKYPKNIKSLSNIPGLQFIVWLTFVISIYIGFPKNSFQQEFTSTLTLLIIYGQVNQSQYIINLERKWMIFIGKISFGIYVYHPLVITVAKSKITFLSPSIGSLLFCLLFLSIVFSSTILIAKLSYTYLESPFLKYKKGYSKLS